jgi:hypothetical protein
MTRSPISLAVTPYQHLRYILVSVTLLADGKDQHYSTSTSISPQAALFLPPITPRSSAGKLDQGHQSAPTPDP